MGAHCFLFFSFSGLILFLFFSSFSLWSFLFFSLSSLYISFTQFGNNVNQFFHCTSSSSSSSSSSSHYHIAHLSKLSGVCMCLSVSLLESVLPSSALLIIFANSIISTASFQQHYKVSVPALSAVHTPLHFALIFQPSLQFSLTFALFFSLLYLLLHNFVFVLPLSSDYISSAASSTSTRGSQI